jgi:demethylmenaquinone methyltransferase/2-methoxy-6-polyprenyl-1,4-benzoquinol methylase
LGNKNGSEDVLRVCRIKEDAKRSYDRLSKFYDLISRPFESKYCDTALKLLNVKEGEMALEVGFGTGHGLKQIAERVGRTGKAYGVDISSGMCKITEKRLKEAGLTAELYCGAATHLPYEDNKFDAVFSSFTLELFDTPEIPVVLGEIRRVMKPNGRICFVSLSKENGGSRMLRSYEWIHKKFPKYADCRPIYLERSVRDAGFEVEHREKAKLFGLPIEIVVGIKG